jgi:hypothetical protein
LSYFLHGPRIPIHFFKDAYSIFPFVPYIGQLLGKEPTMTLKNTTTTLLPLLWLFFLVIDFITRILTGITVFRRWQPFVLIARGVQSIKRLSLFALIIMNVFLAWNFINHTPKARE